jgi:hypothetical protein
MWVNMGNVSIYNALDTSIWSTLSGGTALVTALGGTAIYPGQAPEKTSLPYVVWSYQYGGAENLTPRESTSQLVYVRAYANTAAQAGTIDALICALLHKATLTVTGWNNFWSSRETEIFLPEVDESKVTTWNAGAFYRVRLDQS